MSTLTSAFDPDHPVSFCQGRKGSVYVYQGRGYRGKAWKASANDWRPVGLDAPATAPVITQSASIRYYIARTDVLNPGTGYEIAPVVSFSGGGGSGASALARVSDGGVGAIDMKAYGKNYEAAPAVALSAPPGVLADGTEDTPVALTSSQNDWAAPAASIINLSATVAISITGIVAEPNATRRIIRNVGTQNITFPGESSLSLAANRFLGIATLVLRAGESLSIEYSASSSRWVRVRQASSDVLKEPTPAEASVVTRPHLRGTYLCYYRYKDASIPDSEGGPLYSNLSPLTEVNCGEGKQSISWTYAAPPTGKHVELWRTTSNQALTLYKVATITSGFGAYTDDLTDWELIDPDRAEFAGLPIRLPNGELNANRFGVPPTNYAVAVMFQDRLWMAVDTAGGNPNTLRFSETDEPESMPAENELVLQSNLRATDYITALVPYAGALLAMQSRHCYRLTYVSQPVVDTGVYLMAYRGCLNHRCWDIYEGRVYAMDDQGLYSMDPNGEVENLSLPLYDIWRDRIDYTLSKWFTVRADKRNALLRVCVALKGDGSTKFPSRMLVYSFDYKTWWEERYPDELTCASEVRLNDGQTALVYGTSGGKLRTLSTGLTDLASGSVSAITITNPGRGYKRPPTVTATGGHGAEFECGLNSDGSITSIIIKSPGTKYTAGSLVISAPEAGGAQATASYAVNNSSQSVYYSYKTGCFEYTTDSQDKRGGQVQSRHCSVTYQPTQAQSLLYLKAYYNNAAYPRSNVAARDRGTGFAHSDTVPAAVLDMRALPLQEAESHGVARALFAGRTLDDMMGADRHVSIALSGKQDGGRVVLHNLDVFGVNEKGG
jgi:hypothetical protein